MYRFLSLLVVGLFLASCDVSKPQPQVEAPKTAVEIAFKEILDQHKGKTIYLDFWASWCAPCRKSFPWLNTLRDKFSEDDFVIISINLDMKRKLAEEFLEETPANFYIFYDPDSTIAKQYKVQGMPATYLINSEGELVDSHRGFNINNTAKYEEKIAAVIGK